MIFYTDDLLILDQTMNQEYVNLYRSGLMTAAELNAIREEGLRPQSLFMPIFDDK